MKLKKVLSICKANGLYYLYDRIDRSGEITQWLGDGYALYPLDGLPILDEESFCAVFDITGKQREKILFRHERLPEHLNVEDVAAGDKLVREYETTFINGGSRGCFKTRSCSKRPFPPTGNKGGGIGRNRHEVPRMRICIGPHIPAQWKQQQRPRRAFRAGSVFLQSPAMPAAGSATVLREDGPALLPVEKER